MDARFRSNLEMIGRNEPITKKAKFWQSYVRALKGTDDMRAPDYVHKPRSIFRTDYPDLHTSWNPFGKSIYDDPSHAAERIHSPGYRYLPMHREIYGYTPRQIYPHQYKPIERFVPGIPPSQWTLVNHLGKVNDLTPEPIHRKLILGDRILPGPFVQRLYILKSLVNY
ncbi:PREDICTED: uncharacterized protein LOC105368088 isoform X4 [Ceratosolen solmsi marchali]|uniref:Uncharacterized protein LOC105368088 isoform X4 n=1 Tax=Ceratosolen solmsi marchali TaxID=326594 RepID=A0AAJ7E2E0_9HYME|nr:PREDICTED: uncharacterized protein LOC105368088 isoform X4 [Ceratosolen solmsi marchali]